MAKGGDDTTFKAFETVYHDYMKRLMETWDAMTKRVLDAQRKYGEAAMANYDSADAANKAAGDAQHDYAAVVRDAWNVSQKDYTSAYDEYVKAYRDAWSKADAGALTPTTMNMITQSAGVAASYAASTIGNFQLIAWAGLPPTALNPETRASK